MPPTAHAGTSPVPYPYSALPLAVPLNGSASTPGSGASSITECVWELKSAPPGATAAILSPTSLAGAALQTDRSGTHIVRLRVKNNLGQWSAGTSSGDTNAGWPAAWESAPDSIIKIEVKEPNTGLVIKGEGEHGYIGKDYAWCKEIDRLRGQVSANTSGVAAGTVWIQAVAGDAEADGTPAKPFNPVSAAANTFDGPWAQAIAALEALGLTDRRPRTIVAMGGTYDEDVNFVVAGVLAEDQADYYEFPIPSWAILANGTVSFAVGRKLSFSVTEPEGEGSAVAAFSISPLNEGRGPYSFVVPNPDSNGIGIGGEVGAFPMVRLTGVYANIGVKTACDAAELVLTDCAGSVSIPAAALFIDRSLLSPVVAHHVSRADQSDLTGVVVTSSSNSQGYYNCSMGPTFNGPAGSAKFDLHTAAVFEGNSGVFSGGASKSDYLKIGGKLVSNGELHVVAGGSMAIGTMAGIMEFFPAWDESTGAAFHVYSPYINLDSGTNGQAWLGGASAAAAVKVYNDSPSPGAGVLAYGEVITLNGNGVGTTIHLRATQATGDILIETEGGEITVKTVDGDLNLETNDGDLLATADAGHKMVLEAGDMIHAKPGHTPGQSWNSAFVVDGQVLATIGDAAHGNKGRAVLCLVSEVVELPTESTSPETLWFWNIPANALLQHGSTIRGYIRAKTAANANTKALRLKAGATAIATRTSTANDGWVRLDFEIVAEDTGEQYVWGEGRDSVNTYEPTLFDGIVADETDPITLSIECETASGAGDITLRRIYIEGAFPPKAADVVFEG